MQIKKLVQLVKTKHEEVFAGGLTEEAAAALLSHSFKLVRKKLRQSHDGKFKVEDLGTFRVKLGERESDSKPIRKIMFKDTDDPKAKARRQEKSKEKKAAHKQDKQKGDAAP